MLLLSRAVPDVSVGVVPAERVTVHVTTVTNEQVVSTDLRSEDAEITGSGDAAGAGADID